ncbi:MAG: UDP-N-acetylmuramoyl-L-alanyl-D-glutamate--2,6-diaminopimelate ligase [Alphaproteobacteria bacterium]
MNLSQIIVNLKNYNLVHNSQNLNELQIDDIVIESKKAKKNSIFVGLIGTKNDGANFIPEVVSLGCVVAVIDKKSQFDFQNFLQKNPNFIFIIGEAKLILSEILKAFYQSLPKNIYAITGTNGKTSTAEFVRQILEFSGKKSASIGTLGINCDAEIKNKLADFALTTPDIATLYKNLAILQKNHINDVAIEVSSIGLDQGRVAGLNIEVGAFTNFSQDHLDYHQNMENYFASKMILFTKILPDAGNQAIAVLNADIAEFAKIKNHCDINKIKIIDYGYNAKILKLISIVEQKIDFEYLGEIFSFDHHIFGDFQTHNLLCALGIFLAKNNLNKNELTKLLKNFDKLCPAIGRMQFVENYNNAKIFIDFAHSPDAIENVLKTARKITKNRLIILFGCGGNRDDKKRPIMGEIACELADLAIITDDNPRLEKPEIIRSQIILGCKNNNFIEFPDRKKAIEHAIENLQAGDVLIVAGKGHEDYQIIGTEKFEFNEVKIIKNACKKFS